MKLYRGTQYPKAKGRQKVTSWTPSLAVATIYAARPPGDTFSGRDTAAFRDTSTVHSAKLRKGARVLDLCSGQNTCTFSTMMKELQFGEPDGMTQEDGVKILQGLHGRYMREVGWSGGPFQYIVFEEDEPDEPMDPEEVPFDIRHPQTLISYEVLEEFEWRDMWGVAQRFVIETFALADSPTVRNVARRLGYDAITYQDVFYGGRAAAPLLLGCDVFDLPGVTEGGGIEEDDVPLHQTFRPLNKGTLVDRRMVPLKEVLPQVQCKASNPRKRNPGPTSVDLVRRLRF